MKAPSEKTLGTAFRSTPALSSQNMLTLLLICTESLARIQKDLVFCLKTTSIPPASRRQPYRTSIQKHRCWISALFLIIFSSRLPCKQPLVSRSSKILLPLFSGGALAYPKVPCLFVDQKMQWAQSPKWGSLAVVPTAYQFNHSTDRRLPTWGSVADFLISQQSSSMAEKHQHSTRWMAIWEERPFPLGSDELLPQLKLSVKLRTFGWTSRPAVNLAL